MTNNIIVENDDLEPEYVVEEEDQNLDSSPDVEDLDQGEEIEEEETPEIQIPEKFQNASKEQVVQSYLELERSFGRQANDLGELRKMADNYLRRELERNSAPKQQEKEIDIQFDDLVDNPKEALNRVVEPRIQELSNQVREYEMKLAMRDFQEKHPDYTDIGASPEFQEWATATPYRKRRFEQADRGFDFEAADELLTEFKEQQRILAEAKKEAETRRAKKRDSDLKAATVESGSSGEAGSSKKIYRRADLINLRIFDREKFDSMQDEIELAYREGRVR